MISSDYQMTFGYGRTDSPYGTAAFPYHKGDDWYMPDGTPVVVNSVQIGISGHTGFVTGAHCHIGRFVAGKDTNPQRQGWTLNNPHVTDIGYDDTNGNYVGLLDAQGVRWVYLHMQEKSTNVKVGDYLDKLPKYEEDDMGKSPDLNDGDIVNAMRSVGMDPETDANKGYRKTWADIGNWNKWWYDFYAQPSVIAALEAKYGNSSQAVPLKPGTYQVN